MPKTEKKASRERFVRLAPGHVKYNKAGSVKITKPDGSVETRPAYSRYDFQYAVRRSAKKATTRRHTKRGKKAVR